MTNDQDLKRTRKALEDLEAALKKKLGPVVYELSKAVRRVNRQLVRLQGGGR